MPLLFHCKQASFLWMEAETFLILPPLGKLKIYKCYKIDNIIITNGNDNSNKEERYSYVVLM